MFYVVANFDVQTPGMKITASTYIFLFWRVWVKKNKKEKKTWNSGSRERKPAIRTQTFSFQCLRNNSNCLNLNLPCILQKNYKDLYKKSNKITYSNP